jgi:hypothetical protein
MIIADLNRDFEYIVNRMSTDKSLSAAQETAVGTWISINAASASAEELVIILSTAQLIPNPNPRGTINVSIDVREEALTRALIRKGLAVENDFVFTTSIPDPNWEEIISGPSPLESLGFSPGTILTERDVRRCIR